MMTQAQHIWTMLDDMAANDPQGYKKFIDRQLQEGKEFNKPPQPHMCVETTIQNNDVSSRFYINMCESHRVPAPSTDEDPIPVIGGPLLTERDNHGFLKCVCVAFNPNVLTMYGRMAGDSRARSMLINLAIDYIQDIHKIQISRKFKVLDTQTLFKGNPDCIRQSFKKQLNKQDKEFEQELSELEHSFGPLASGCKDTLLNQLSKISTDQPEVEASNKSSDIKLIPETANKQVVIEELSSIPKPSYSLHHITDAHGRRGLVVDVALPGVKKVSECELDVSEDDLVLLVPEKYELTVSLPEKVNEDETVAKFNSKTSHLAVTMWV